MRQIEWVEDNPARAAEEIERMGHDINELKTALRPFARGAVVCDIGNMRGQIYIHHDGGMQTKLPFKHEDLKRAKDLLNRRRPWVGIFTDNR